MAQKWTVEIYRQVTAYEVHIRTVNHLTRDDAMRLCDLKRTEGHAVGMYPTPKQ